MSSLTAKKQREAIRRFMEKKNLRVYPWAKKAGISEAALRAFLKGDTNTMQISTMAKLAASVGSTIDIILSGGEISEKEAEGYINAGKAHVKAINPDLVYEATQLANDLAKNKTIDKSDVKELALEAAEAASTLGSNLVTKHLLLYLIEAEEYRREIEKNKKL